MTEKTSVEKFIESLIRKENKVNELALKELESDYESSRN